MPSKESTAVEIASNADASSTKAKKPTYHKMITEAIIQLKERNGSSRPAIKKFIHQNFNIEPSASFDVHFNQAIKKGISNDEFLLPKGPSGTIKLKKPEPKKAAPKKSAVAKKAVAAKKEAKETEEKPVKKAAAPKKAAASKKTEEKPAKKAAAAAAAAPKKAEAKPAKKAAPAPKKAAAKPAPKKAAAAPKKNATSKTTTSKTTTGKVSKGERKTRSTGKTVKA